MIGSRFVGFQRFLFFVTFVFVLKFFARFLFVVVVVVVVVVRLLFFSFSFPLFPLVPFFCVLFALFVVCCLFFSVLSLRFIFVIAHYEFPNANRPIILLYFMVVIFATPFAYFV